MRHFLFGFLLIFFVCTTLSAQVIIDKSKAELSVKNYMLNLSGKYKPIIFGELFLQNNSEEIKFKLNSKEQIKYSLIHTYKLGNDTIKRDYFHLDVNYQVVGKLTYQEMEAIMLKQNKGILDSIMKIINTNSNSKN